MKVLLFDNYDSFTYNLFHILDEIIGDCGIIDVIKNDHINLDEVSIYDRIIISPGCGIPSESGILLPLVKEYIEKKPILGVCLGMQAICQSLGGKLINLNEIHHGVETVLSLTDNKSIIYENLKEPIVVGRYNSWVVDKEDFPKELEITALDEEGFIMSVQHKKFNVCGLQYHPESILTPQGKYILKNWINSQ